MQLHDVNMRSCELCAHKRTQTHIVLQTQPILVRLTLLELSLSHALKVEGPQQSTKPNNGQENLFDPIKNEGVDEREGVLKDEGKARICRLGTDNLLLLSIDAVDNRK